MRDVAYIALGSNLGDRHEHLARARDAIAQLPSSRVVAESSIDETAPLGQRDQPMYLNQMVALETSLTPRQLLSRLQAIEQREGRARHERWASRTLDLDIVCFDAQTASETDLEIPHPGLADRPFWQRELAELRGGGETMTQQIGEARVVLPDWACVTEKRKGHISRVVSLLMRWADEIEIGEDERRTWRDAGLLHDALRDAPESELRRLSGDEKREEELLHGPAVANLLESQGNTNASLLEAVRYHTVGSPRWDRAGRALYMADFLEPGRGFLKSSRAFLAVQVPHDFDGVFRQVLRTRLEHALREGFTLFPETVGLWNEVR